MGVKGSVGQLAPACGFGLLSCGNAMVSDTSAAKDHLRFASYSRRICVSW